MVFDPFLPLTSNSDEFHVCTPEEGTYFLLLVSDSFSSDLSVTRNHK